MGGWAAARAGPAMLGGSPDTPEQEAEGDGAGALPAPPAIDFPTEGSDPKYDGEGRGVPRRPSSCPPHFHSRVRRGLLGGLGGFCRTRA